MSDATPIPLPGLKRVWKVCLVDNIEKPTLKATLMVRGETMQDVMTKTPRSMGFQAFKERHPETAISEIGYLGTIEN